MYHPKCAPHLLLADDVMVFTKPSRNAVAVSIFLQSLDEFAYISGLSCNLHNGQIFVASTDEGLKQYIHEVLNMELGSFGWISDIC